MKVVLGSYFEIDTKNHGIKMELSLTEWGLKYKVDKNKATAMISFGPLHLIYINYPKLDKKLEELIKNFDESPEMDFDLHMDKDLNQPRNFTLN